MEAREAREGLAKLSPRPCQIIRGRPGGGVAVGAERMLVGRERESARRRGLRGRIVVVVVVVVLGWRLEVGR